MSGTNAARSPTRRPPGHDVVRGSLRFAAELTAMVATAWALWPVSIPLAIAAAVVLIALPAVFSTPGDRPGGGGPIAVPGVVTILFVVIDLAAATVAAWVVWPWWLALAVTILCLVVIGTEQTRWKALIGTDWRQHTNG